MDGGDGQFSHSRPSCWESCVAFELTVCSREPHPITFVSIYCVNIALLGCHKLFCASCL